MCGESCTHGVEPVSYTHLDVYKRQDEAQALYCKEKEEFDALAKRLNTPVEPADDEQEMCIRDRKSAGRDPFRDPGPGRTGGEGE